MQYIIFMTVAPVAVAIVLMVVIMAWRRRDTHPAVALLWLSLTTLGWLVFNSLELVSPSPSWTLRWAKVTYVFVAAAPLAWLIFALQYVDRGEWLDPGRVLLFATVPAGTAVMALTNEAHGLLWREYRFVPGSGFLHMRTLVYGLWFWVHIGYSYACMLVGGGLILAHYFQSARIYRRQARWVVAGALTPVIVNLIYVLRLVPGLMKDYSPLAFSIAGAFFAASIFRYRLLDLRPIGRDQLLRGMHDGVIVVDREQCVVDVNPATRRLVESGDDQLIGRPLSAVLPVASSLLTSPSREKTFHRGISFDVDGAERHYELRISDITNQRRRLIGHLVVLQDVTERHDTMMRLRRQERLAAIGQLAGGIAHDFNNLIGSITLHAQLAQRNLPQRPDAVPETLEVIVEESHRAADLVDQILDFSRTQVMNTEPLDLGAFVENVVSILRRTIREDVHLLVDAPSQPCVVDADPTRIQQILINLATNARDAMPDGGELHVVVDCGSPPPDSPPANAPAGESGWARLIVSDTGVGMDEETRDHIFEPFFTTKGPDRGTGLGLAQVYGIVRQHSGCIDVESAVGEGTTFTIHLPLVMGLIQRDDHEEGRVPPGRGETILVVEDAKRYRQAIKHGLESLNYRVLTAPNGRDALEILSLESVDLVLTDVVMPEMGGTVLLERLQQQAPELNAVAITGFPIDGDPEELRDVGFTAVIDKPFSLRRLATVVRRVLDHRRD